jgi:hypothetical protein
MVAETKENQAGSASSRRSSGPLEGEGDALELLPIMELGRPQEPELAKEILDSVGDGRSGELETKGDDRA